MPAEPLLYSVKHYIVCDKLTDVSAQQLNIIIALVTLSVRKTTEKKKTLIKIKLNVFCFPAKCDFILVNILISCLTSSANC